MGEIVNQRHFAAACAAALLACAAPGGVRADTAWETVQLKNGMQVRGDVLKHKPEVLVVDIGFVVLSIPAEQVERVVGGTAAEVENERRDLYYVAAGRDELSVERNVERCSEAVVEIRTSIGMGSGFVVDPTGYVVTCDHVVAGEHRISVIVFAQQGGELRREQHDNVRIVASDPFNDLALLKIENPPAAGLTYLPLDDADELYQGQSVFAIGSPLGFTRTVSDGIISAPARALDGRLLVQHGVQINPGNSGGPLIDLRGRVVGVNNMKIAAVQVEGLGFSVPAATVARFLRHRDAYAFDRSNPNAGFRYNAPPQRP
jgi:serine protease Do